MAPRIYVFSEDAIEESYGRNPPTDFHCVISIRSPGCPGVDWKSLPSDYRAGLMVLEFHDLTGEKDGIDGCLALFSTAHARRIVDFCKRHALCQEWFINCEAGISRSAGVAAAMSKFMTGDDSEYFKRYLPNARVYRMLLDEFGRDPELGQLQAS